ncbi:MAG: glycosyltransferase [Rhizomicrobium sp.]
MIERKALILSPSASHPQDYGNRNRVFQTTSWLKNQGFDIHFVLYPYESDWVHGMPDSAEDIRRAWSSFTVIPPSRPLHAPPEGAHHQIDEWWDPQIGAYLEWLFAREAFDIFVVNYTFFSKAFDFAPKSTIKVLETHDIFSGRKELFQAHGAEPEFFYTTAEQEKIALERADIVVAIKDGEAAHLRSLTDRVVVSVPFNVVERPVTRRPERLDQTQALRVGFIGALNTVNVLNMARFLRAFAKFERIYVPPPIEIHVAGNVCTQLKSTSDNVKLLGHVFSVDDYYSSIDVVVAPMAFSTGMKIKVGEALSFGRAVVSTQNGFDGFPSTDEFHALDDVAAVCRALMKLAFDRERLTALEEHSAFAAQLARRRSASGYAALAKAIGRLSKAIVFVTDQPFWRAETVIEERLAQWAEFCAHFARTTIVYAGSEPVGAIAARSRQFARNTRVVAAADTEQVFVAINEMAETHALADIVVAVGGMLGADICASLRGRFDSFAIDRWIPELTELAGARDATGDIGLAGDDVTAPARTLSTTALRYLPDALRTWPSLEQTSDTLIVLCDPDDFDLYGVDVIQSRLTRLTGGRKTHDIVSFTDKFVQSLAERRPPGLLLAIGRNLQGVEICRCIAAYTDIAFIHVTTGEMPVQVMMPDGRTELCAGFGDVAHLLPELAGARHVCASEHLKDTGWSTYWRHLAGA